MLKIKCDRLFANTVTLISVLIFGVIMAVSVSNAEAQAISEGFEAAPPTGWEVQNRSTTIGTTGWFQGNAVFPAHSGPATSYIGANFNNTTGTNTISNWLFPPSRTFNNGDVITFYTRVGDGSPFPDRLELRLSTNGAGTNVGTTADSVGDFTTLLLSVNPNLIGGGYPDQWTQFTITLADLPGPTVGRLAFRYFVTNGGPSGDNSNFIGIDTFQYTPFTTPTESQLQFSSTNFTGTEADGAATITVNRTNGTTGAVSVNFATSNGSATGGASCITGVDYVSTNGTLNFADGESSQTFPVTICNDAENDPGENVNLTLSNPTGGTTLGFPSTAILTIDVPDNPTSYDFFGNGLTDFAVLTFPTSGGQIRWRVLRNDNPSPPGPGQATIFDIPWGQSATDILPNIGDYDGNGITDLTVFRSNTYYTLPLNGTGQAPGNPIYQQWGLSTDFVGADGDYDGDGKMDNTVIRDVNGSLVWYVLRSSDSTVAYFYYGTNASDIPLAGADYNGDGIDDPTVVRIGGSGQLSYYVGNTNGGIQQVVQWGSFLTDFVVPGGDYDGDGKADFMVWRGFGNGTDGVWYLRTSSGNVSYTQFGIPGDDGTRDRALRGGDYDGDGKDDIAVYRDSNTTFYVLRSSGGVQTQQWGVPGNLNIPVAAFGVQ